MPDYKTQFALTPPLELEFFDREGQPIGKLRIKPSTLLWKPFNASKFRSVSIESFSEWVKGKRKLVTR